MGSQNTTQRLQSASKGLGAAAGAVQAIPVVGQIAGAFMGLASLFTGLGAKKREKEEAELRQKRLEDEANKQDPFDRVAQEDNSLNTTNKQAQGPQMNAAPVATATPMFQSPGPVQKQGGQYDHILSMIQGK